MELKFWLIGIFQFGVCVFVSGVRAIDNSAEYIIIISIRKLSFHADESSTNCLS